MHFKIIHTRIYTDIHIYSLHTMYIYLYSCEYIIKFKSFGHLCAILYTQILL